MSAEVPLRQTKPTIEGIKWTAKQREAASVQYVQPYVCSCLYCMQQ